MQIRYYFLQIKCWAQVKRGTKRLLYITLNNTLNWKHHDSLTTWGVQVWATAFIGWTTRNWWVWVFTHGLTNLHELSKQISLLLCCMVLIIFPHESHCMAWISPQLWFHFASHQQIRYLGFLLQIGMCFHEAKRLLWCFITNNLHDSIHHWIT